MGHNLATLASASLDTCGGLVTLAPPQDLPEGASPRCFDVDFVVGAVFTRPGLKSTYTFATTLLITGFVLGSSGIATFTYTGIQPIVNEEFLLSGFTGDLTFLNGTTVLVISSTLTTFVVTIVGLPLGPFSGLTGIATSLSGVFVGPNLGGIAENESTDGNPWTNPNGILGNTTYASVTIGGVATGAQFPTLAANQGSTTPAWTNPTNVFVTGSVNFSTVTLSIAANNPAPPPPPGPPSGGGGGGGAHGGGQHMLE